MEDSPFASRLAAAAGWLALSPAEVVGLILLAVAGLAVAGLVWWRSVPVALAPAPVPTAAAAAEAAVDKSATEVVVHVTGAVREEGLVTLVAGARVADAVAAAGGTTVDAATDRINLARTAVDGEQIHVPSVGEEPTSMEQTGSPGVLGDGRVELNRATAEDLQTLPGVGPVLAERIVAFREANGPFASPGDLRQVSGIGEKTFQTLAELVVVS